MNLSRRIGIERHRAEGRAAIFRHLSGAKDVTFIRLVGNLGDELIWAGTRALLRGHGYRELFVGDVLADRGGDLALVSGGGGWCAPFHELSPWWLPRIEEKFRRVVVLPSSFDVSVPEVTAVLASSTATFFARERDSFDQIRDLCSAELAADCAFHFDFGPYRQKGSGVLTAFRTDAESSGGPVPEGNVDVSVECSSLDHWLDTIAKHDTVLTDRAHVLIAAASLGKRVFWRPGSYHKVEGIVAYSLSGSGIGSVLPEERFRVQHTDSG